MYRTMAKADTGLNCRRCHFGGSLQPSDFFVVMHQHQHQNQHQHLRRHHHSDSRSDSVQAQNEIIPAMLLSFRGCSLMGGGLKSPSVRVRQQRLLDWLPLAANGMNSSTALSLPPSLSLSRLLFIEIYCIFNKIATRYGIRDSTFSRNSENS